MYDYGARWLDPYLNLWTQPDTIIPDPSNPKTLNRYSYCLNNPLNCVDPDGHAPVIPLPIPDQWVEQAVEWAGPVVSQLAVDLSQWAMEAQAWYQSVPQMTQFASDQGANQASNLSNSNSTSSGDPDPNDPWGRFRNLRRGPGLKDVERRLASGRPDDVLGAQRQVKLMDRLGDNVSNVEVQFKNNIGGGRIDVQDTAGNLYEVGGPSKVMDVTARNDFGRQLAALVREATLRGVKAYFAYEGPEEWRFTVDRLCRRAGIADVIDLGTGQ